MELPSVLSTTGLQTYFNNTHLKEGTFTKIVPASPRKFDFPFTNFSLNIPIHQHTIFDRKAPRFCTNWVLFTIICSKYTQFLWAPSSVIKLLDHIPSLRYATEPQKGGTYMYATSMWVHPLAIITSIKETLIIWYNIFQIKWKTWTIPKNSTLLWLLTQQLG